MRKYRFIPLILSTFLILQIFMTMSQAASIDRPYNILILNAYHYTYSWTFDINVGANDVLSKQYPDAIIYTEFLDWKRYPDMELVDYIQDTLAHKYQDTPIDLILTTDDMGLTFALEHREDLFSNAPIVFSGIIEFTAKEIIGNEKNVTGVYEQMDPTGTVELLHHLQPDVDKVYIIHDLSESGIRTSDNLKMAFKDFEDTKYFDLVDLSDQTFIELEESVRFLENNSALFMVSYSSSADGQKEKPESFGDFITSASSVPVYSIDPFLIEHGIIGGSFLSGLKQGESLANLGIQILEGTPADSIPHNDKATVDRIVDEDVLKLHNINKDLVPNDFTIINEDISFYEAYTAEVLITLAIFMMLLSLIIALVFNIRKRHFSEQEILGKNQELQALYEQIQASEEELIAQNEELESYQEQLVHDARYDALTNLPNRHYLSIYGNDLISRCTKSGKKLILFFIDLDNFRYINNTHGHFFGDALLKSIAMRLEQIKNIQFSVRFGGDEFVTLAIVDPDDLQAIITSISDDLKNTFVEPYNVNQNLVNITSSIGYSIYPDDGHNIDEMILQADMAMYETKKEHITYAVHYKEGMREKYEDTFALISGMKSSFENKEFAVYYQPQIELKTGKIIGFESLARWFSPKFGIVPPNKFIPLAESSGFINQLGEYVMDQSIQFVNHIKPCLPGGFKVSINVSVIQLMEADFINTIKKYLDQYNVGTEFIQLEITESLLIQSYDLIIEKLNTLRSLGISLSLDDFGTGYSSLSHLQQLPIDELKIDKIFVDHILDEDQKELELVDAILKLAKTSDLCVIAEGVEYESQIEYLRNKGCDRIQGYYYSKPLPLEDAKLYCKNKGS